MSLYKLSGLYRFSLEHKYRYKDRTLIWGGVRKKSFKSNRGTNPYLATRRLQFVSHYSLRTGQTSRHKTVWTPVL